MVNNTSKQYDEIVTNSRAIYQNKMKDYGASWRVLRVTSVADQIYIKGQRIRTIQESKQQMIDEGIEPEFKGILNYSLIALIQMELGFSDKVDIDLTAALKYYDSKINNAKELMLKKNHDYGEAWREMRVSSIIDMIMVKILRIKQIEDNDGATLVSEGADGNFYDIINYSIFALIKLKEA